MESLCRRSVEFGVQKCVRVLEDFRVRQPKIGSDCRRSVDGGTQKFDSVSSRCDQDCSQKIALVSKGSVDGGSQNGVSFLEMSQGWQSKNSVSVQAKC
jgi:hypothetical protein